MEELGEKIDKSKQIISQYESEDDSLQPSFDVVCTISEQLKFPVSFFYTEVNTTVKEVNTYFRALLSSNKKDKIAQSKKATVIIKIYKFLENGNGYFSQEDLRLFQLFRERIGRLGEEAQNLREHCLQVWELFQAELDLRQNRIMKVLTIVTTVFMPLTLLVGWYGMNFHNMPELSWEHGYLAMILVSGLTVFLTIWLLKKKKLW